MKAPTRLLSSRLPRVSVSVHVTCARCIRVLRARIAFQYPDTKDEAGFWSVKLNSWVVETRVRKARETWLITKRETP